MNHGIDNERLVVALKKMSVQPNKRNIDMMISELIKSQLLVPVEVAKPQRYRYNESELEPDNKIAFNKIKDQTNDKFYLAFTDENELIKWSKKEFQEVLVCELEDFIKILKSKKSDCIGFVINPYNEQIFIDYDVLNYILKSYQFDKNHKLSKRLIRFDTNIKIVDPLEFPQDFVWDLTRLLKRKLKVRKAYLKQIIKGNNHSLALVLDCSGDQAVLFHDIQRIAKESLSLPLEVYYADSDFGLRITEISKPIYEKQFKFF